MVRRLVSLAIVLVAALLPAADVRHGSGRARHERLRVEIDAALVKANAGEGGAAGAEPASATPDAELFFGDLRGVPALRKNPLANEVDEARVERVFASLDLRARAAQLLLAYPQAETFLRVEVGGVLYVGNSLGNIAKAKERIASVYARARVPPFVAVDVEGGFVNRMKSYPGLEDIPVARDMAALDDKEVRAWGKKVGEAMRAVGVNLNLAPVLDVAASGRMANNRRSFSGDAAVVVQKARAYAEGLLAEGVVPVGKHFPGYGDISGDSDHEPTTTAWNKVKVLAQVAAFDGAKDVLGAVMMSNVVYASVDSRPAILSRPFVDLAHERGWITITDDISIKVLADSIGGTTADVLRASLMAGNDLFLTTTPPTWKGIDLIGVLSAYARENPTARENVDAACRRVLRLKDRMGLLDGR